MLLLGHHSLVLAPGWRALVCVGLLSAGCAHHLPSPSSPAVVPPSQPYTFEIVGERQLVSTMGISEYPISWSPDGKYLAVTTFDGIEGRDGIFMEIINVKNGRKKRLLPPSQFRDFHPTWSPDGKRLLFFSNRSGNLDVWSVKSNGTDLRQLTTDPMEDLYGTWSPDGTQIAFLSTRSKEVAIWTMNGDGSAPRQITAGGNGDWGAAWSPDGAMIVFGSTRLSALNQSKGDLLVIETPHLFERILVGGIPSEAIWVVNLHTLTLQKLTREEETGGLHWHPVWSPDGMTITYISDDAGSMDIWTMDPDGTHPKRLTTSDGYEVFPAWSPDGNFLAIASADDRSGFSDIKILTIKRKARL